MVSGVDLLCRFCGSSIPEHIERCVVCQRDVGFPNVRATKCQEEIEALDKRLKDAMVSAEARKCQDILEDFGGAVLASKVVIARNLTIVLNLVSSSNAMYISFYKQVSSGMRLPEGNKFDRGRSAVDGVLFPYYKDKIQFAALSLDNCGVRKYGDYNIILKEDIIRHRSSVFEENSFKFCQETHKIIAGDRLPCGYRACWEDRGKLAMSKLHSEFDWETRKEQYPGILLKQGTGPENVDFIEVHIFGEIHRRAIEKVVGPKPKNREKALWKSLERKLSEVGAVLEVK